MTNWNVSTRLYAAFGVVSVLTVGIAAMAVSPRFLAVVAAPRWASWKPQRVQFRWLSSLTVPQLRQNNPPRPPEGC